MPFGSPHHSTLPTGRLDSPSGLDKAKSDVPVGFSLPKPNTSANFTGKLFLPLSSPKPVLSQPKWTASLVGSIDQGRSIESCRARMASQDDPLERSPDVTKWNPGMLMGAEESRITLRFIRATACEARAPGTHFLGYVFWANKKGNSLQQERK